MKKLISVVLAFALITAWAFAFSTTVTVAMPTPALDPPAPVTAASFITLTKTTHMR